MQWDDLKTIDSKSYVCGHCGNPLASNRGFRGTGISSSGHKTTIATIYICHRCTKPTFFQGGDQIPGSAFGGHVEHIPSDEVAKLYDEARNCMKVNAYTAAVMCCRKLLMNVAVSEGADEGKSFAF